MILAFQKHIQASGTKQYKENILIAQILMMLSAGIIFTLGATHLLYTFWGPYLTPRDSTLQASMARTSLVISKETTMWRAWIGFNASHSIGALLFGLVFGYLALAHNQLLFQSVFLMTVGLATLIGLLILSRLYWFGVPFIGISTSLTSYLASIAVSLV